MGSDLPKIMRKQKWHLRKLPEDKRCSLRNPLSFILCCSPIGHDLILFLTFWVWLFTLLTIFNGGNRPWDAAKHMESAAALAKELSNWSEVADFYRRASELYIESGRSQPASDALAKGAR